MINQTLLKKAADEYGTTLYIFDKDQAKEVCREYQKRLNGAADLCYAMKTNPFLTEHMAGYVERIEVCSMGEFYICKNLNIPPEKLFISGVLKKEEDVGEILTYCGEKAHITIESLKHFEMIHKWCEENGCSIKVYPRLSSGNQFGMDEKTILNLIGKREEYPLLQFEGIHYFSGTQKKSVKKNAKELSMLDAFLKEITDKTGLVVKELEYGTGERAAYFQDETDNRFQDMEQIGQLICDMEYNGRVTLEMGRAFAADCGYYVTKVWDVKHTGDKNYCIMDGGIHQLNYDGQIRGMYMPKVLHIPEDESSGGDSQMEYTICGALCTANDVLIQKFSTDTIKVNDILVFCNAGAYSMTEGPLHFLSHNLPQILLYTEESGFTVARGVVETWKWNMARS